MAQRLRVDEAALSNVSARLTNAGHRLTDARGRLEGGLSTQGQCWGTSDEVARNFASEYVHGRDEVLEGSRNLAQLLAALGEAIGGATHSFVSTEHGNT